MNDSVTAAQGVVLDARYRLIEKLGAGGQAEVWRVHDAGRGHDIALKILKAPVSADARAWASLAHEHSISRTLTHPFILEVFPPERLGDLAVLPMELAAGGDLSRLRGRHYLEIVPVVIEVALALEHAHERGVIHRDLKPGNVLFDIHGRVKLADFGIAQSSTGAPTADSSKGSPFSASPEQLRGEPPQPSDDLYGLGALLYELLSGYPPHYPHFDALRIRSEPAPPLVPVTPVPPPLAALVTRMLDKDPTRRPGSMREVIEELDAVLQDTASYDLEVRPDEDEGDEDDERATAAGLSRPPARARATPPPRPIPPDAQALDAAEKTQELPSAGMRPATPPRPTLVSTSAAARADQDPTPSVTVTAMARARGGVVRTVSRPKAPAATRAAAPAAAPPRAAAAAPAPRPAPAAAAEPDPWKELGLDEPADPDTLARLHQTRWLLALAGALIGLLLIALLWSNSHPGPDSHGSRVASSSSGPPAQGALEERFRQGRSELEHRLASLESRGAGVWGGVDYAGARTLQAEASGAHDAGNVAMAEERLQQAQRLLDGVEKGAGNALAAALAAGDKALATGQQELALQSFELARRIAPADPRVATGERRARGLNSLLPQLAQAHNAETAHNYARAIQEYSRVLKQDPGNPAVRDALARVTAAADEERFSKAIGRGFTALAAGRLGEARQAFEKARSLRPAAVEPGEGLRRVAAAAAGKGFTAVRSKAQALEEAGRWDEAAELYDAVLQQDPSLVFALEGRERAQARAGLGHSLQALIDHPERLLLAERRDQANALLQKAGGEGEADPAVHEQAIRLRRLLSQVDSPVHLSLVSDNATEVAIAGVSTLGVFGRRDLDLRPGQYTLIGTRSGYREVRREITVAPGEENVTINVSCSEPLSPT